MSKAKVVLPDTKLDIVDCILLAKGAAEDTELFSFDTHLRPKRN